MQQRSYARTAGVRLLDHLVDRHGLLFTSGEAVLAGAELGLSAGHVYKLLHDLARSGYLRRLAKSLYTVESPLAIGAAPHSFAIATHLVQPSAISRWSALQHWGLVEQVPFVITASTPKVVVTPAMRSEVPRQRDRSARSHAAWVIDGVRYEFVRIPADHMFGIDYVWVDARSQVPMFDRERALLDAFVQMRGFGAGGLGEQVLAEHWQDVDVRKLVGYARQMGRPLPMRRLADAWRRVTGQALPGA